MKQAVSKEPWQMMYPVLKSVIKEVKPLKVKDIKKTNPGLYRWVTWVLEAKKNNILSNVQTRELEECFSELPKIFS